MNWEELNSWLHKYNAIIWFIGLVLIGGYILWDYNTSCRAVHQAYEDMLLGETNYTSYLLANGWETVPYPAYEVVKTAYNDCQYVLCKKNNASGCEQLVPKPHAVLPTDEQKRVSIATFQQTAGAFELCEMKLCEMEGKKCDMGGQQPVLPYQIR